MLQATGDDTVNVHDVIAVLQRQLQEQGQRQDEEMAKLRQQHDQEITELRQQNAALEKRLTALETGHGMNAETHQGLATFCQ